jgi:Fe-S-cluster-containing hydrogenase component 2
MTKEHVIEKVSGGMAERKGVEDSGILYDMPSCGGCRTCELACSFHHTQEFIPSVSSLKVLSKEEGPGYRVLLITESRGKSIACDGCKGLDVPLCMEYCKEMDDLGKILLSFEGEKVQKNK